MEKPEKIKGLFKTSYEAEVAFGHRSSEAAYCLMPCAALFTMNKLQPIRHKQEKCEAAGSV